MTTQEILAVLRKQIADELDGMREDITAYYEVGIPIQNHGRDLRMKLEASAQAILDLFPKEIESATKQIMEKFPACDWEPVDGQHIFNPPLLPPAQDGN